MHKAKKKRGRNRDKSPAPATQNNDHDDVFSTSLAPKWEACEKSTPQIRNANSAHRDNSRPTDPSSTDMGPLKKGKPQTGDASRFLARRQ